MKNLVAIVITALFFTSIAPAAERTANVTLRYSRQGPSIRVVLQTDDDTIRNSIIHASPAEIRVDLPSAFEISKPRDFIFETAKTERTLSIKLSHVKEVKTAMLTDPSRIVFDITAPPPTPQRTLPPFAPSVSPGPHSETASPSAPPAGQKGSPISEGGKNAAAIRVVVLDPGHGGYEYGITEGRAREKDVNLALSRQLGAALVKMGQTVYLTRKVDQSVSLAERINFANSKNPDLFISIHAGLSNNFVIYLASPGDQNVDATVRLYALTYRHTRYIDKSKAAAAAIGLSIRNDFKTGAALRELPLPVLDSLNAPAILIEYPDLKSFASDQKMREKLVSSIMKGITAYEP
jgi:N-acetylmuramoyl-L-alanine amidase